MDTVRAIWSILSARERSTAAGLLLLLLGGTLLEVLGIGVVVPAVMVLVSAPGDRQIPALDAWLARLGHPPHAQLVLAGLVGLFLLYAAKATYLLLAAYCQSRFVAGLQTTLGKRLFTAYMSQPWADHIRRNSAKMIHQIGELHSFADLCSLAISTFSELLVLAGIVLLLMWFEPLGASVVGGVFLVAAGLLGWWTRGPTRKWGETRLEHATLALQHMRQGFGGLKDAKILRRERHFIGRFARHADLVTRMATRQLFVGQVPRLWFELNAVAALCLLTAVMLREGRPPQVIVPTLALFATAAFRALPSLNRMSSAFHHLAFASGMVEGLRRDLEGGPTGSPPGPTADLAFRDSIALEGVSFRHDGRPENSVDEVTIRIPHGSSVGLIGGSGAGKSTLVDLILGLLPPSRGRITVDGVDIHDNLPGWQRKLGYVGQIIYLTDESIRSNVAFGLPDDLIDDGAVLRALAAARLDGFVAGLPDGVNTLVGERGVRLSGGQRQRIGIARALYGDPEVLLLDEATSNLDDETEREVMAAVNSLHGVKTLIIVAHRMSTVADCDVLHRLAAGRVVQSGTLGEVVSP